MRTLDVSVKSTARTYVVQIDDKPLTLIGGEASIGVKPGDAVVYWWMAGNPGSTISIELKAGASTLWKVEKDSIPAGREKAWGLAELKVPA